MMFSGDKRFDIRLIKRNIERGIVTKEEYEQYLASLNDAGEKARKVTVPQPSNVAADAVDESSVEEDDEDDE